MDELLNSQSLVQYLRDNNLPLLDRFGQNFLIDENVLNQIVEATQVESNVPVVEIGVGLGVLTKAIAEKRKTKKTTTCVFCQTKDSVLPIFCVLIFVTFLKSNCIFIFLCKKQPLD